MINEYDKIRLKTGEIGRVVEILRKNTAYIAEISKKDNKISVEQISHDEILSVFEEVEHPMGEIKEYQKIKLKDGRVAYIAEVLEQGVAYLADIYDGKGDYDHDQIKHSDIYSVIQEVEKPLEDAV